MGKCNKWKWCERHRREELCYKSGIKYLCCTWSGILLFEATLRLDMNIIRPSVFISSMWRLVNCHSHTYKLKKKNWKMKIKDFSKTNQKCKITEQTATLKTGEAGKYRQTQSISIIDRSSKQKISEDVDYLKNTVNLTWDLRIPSSNNSKIHVLLELYGTYNNIKVIF